MKLRSAIVFTVATMAAAAFGELWHVSADSHHSPDLGVGFAMVMKCFVSVFAAFVVFLCSFVSVWEMS